jgi:hypothetical protein
MAWVAISVGSVGLLLQLSAVICDSNYDYGLTIVWAAIDATRPPLETSTPVTVRHPYTASVF